MNDESNTSVPMERIEGAVYTVRGKNVLFDRDLASLYGVETRALNQAVTRNQERFPRDFAFQLTSEEWSNLKSQIVTSNPHSLISQTVTSKGRGGTPRS
jgi:hypothetical protein